MAAPTCGLTIIKQFPYRGDTHEEFSNHYWLTGSTPSDSTAWRALFDALVAEEKKCYTNQSKVVGGYGYNSVSDDAVAVWSVDLLVAPNSPVNGTCTPAYNILSPGDCAYWVRWGLDRMNTRGKRVYLRKYFHPAYSISSSGGDTLSAELTTALNAFGAKLQDGSFLDGRKITDKLGTAIVGHASGPYITTRTLKRRGKRPGA